MDLVRRTLRRLPPAVATQFRVRGDGIGSWEFLGFGVLGFGGLGFGGLGFWGFGVKGS